MGELLFAGFIWFWLGQVLQPSAGFLIVISFALILSAITAVVPDASGRQHVIHRLAAWSMAIAMLASLIILLQEPLGSLQRCITILAALYMVALLLLFVFVVRSRRYFLVLQASYLLSFYIAMIAVAYQGRVI